MNKLWLAVFLTSVSWLFSTSVFTPANKYSWVFIALSIIISLYCFIKSEKLVITRLNVYFLIPLTIVSILLPYPYNLGTWAIAAGILLCADKRLKRFGNGISLVGIILLFQNAVISIYYILAPRLHESKVLAYLLMLLLKPMGLSAGLQDENIYIQSNKETLRLFASYEMFGSMLFMLFAVSGAVILFLTNAKARKYVKFAVILTGYFLLRLSLIAMLITGGADANLMWYPWFGILSSLPLFLLLMRFVPLDELRSFEPLTFSRRFILVALFSCLSLVMLVGVFEFHDPGVKKEGRVLLDEKHSNWEWTSEEYDTKWFGAKSGYNYNSFYQYLDLYYKLERNTDTITKEKLADFDVLIIKTPTAAFSEDEIKAIEEFVYKGGGLFIIGDHTNVFGTSTYINQLAKPYGIRLNYDATYELVNGRLSEYNKPTVFPHPIVANFPTFLFATSCTMDTPILSDDVITGYGLKAARGSYSQNNFFPETEKKSEFNFGLFQQAASVNYGLGRVFTFTDSTVFSNFWMYMPGKPQLALNSLNWLNHRNTVPNLKILFLCAFIALLIVSITLSRGLHKSNTIYSLALGALLAIAISLIIYPGAHRLFYKEPAERTSYTKVSFEQEYSDFTVPSTWDGFTSKIDTNYQTFYVWNQRLGYVPSIETTFSKAMEKGNLFVIINPSKQLDTKQREALNDAVKNGLKLLILGDSSNAKTINKFIEPFGLSISAKSIKQPEISIDGKSTIRLTESAGVVNGGIPIITTTDKDSICSSATIGKGSVTVFSDSALFSNRYMGDVSQVPNEEQKKISDLHFWLIKGIVEGK